MPDGDDVVADEPSTRQDGSEGSGIVRLGNGASAPGALRGGVVAIGNFDGVHLGHLAVLEPALARARAQGLPAVVLTFEPHPRELFGGGPVFRLTPPAEKAAVLGRLGFDAVVERPFDRNFAALTAPEFVDRVVVGDLGARHVVVGHDFRYGAKRGGDAGTLAADDRFTTAVIDAHLGGGDPVSSSRIREALGEGDCATASALLGRRWRVGAPVEHGRKVGRTLGYPTANMVLPEGSALAHGIYAVRLRRADGALHGGVASYGRRPTFDDGAPLLETFLFDFDGDLYGEPVNVSLFERLRGEERFEDIGALIDQMDRDAANARRVLAGATPLSPLDAALSFA